MDWALIGQTFAHGWNVLIHFIEGLVTTPGIWASIGQSIGQFVKSWFTNIDINSIATSLIATFNGVTELINAFLDQNPFEGVAEKIYTAINRVLHEVNWAELGAAISASIPCHPEYDLLDVLSFTGGHAPDNCHAPITSIIRNINGGVTIQCAVPQEQVNPTRETIQVEGLSGSSGTIYTSDGFWIQMDSFPEAEKVISGEGETTELTVNCTVDNTNMQIAWTGYYTLSNDAMVTARVLLDGTEIYRVL